MQWFMPPDMAVVTCRFDPLSLGSDPQILKW